MSYLVRSVCGCSVRCGIQHSGAGVRHGQAGAGGFAGRAPVPPVSAGRLRLSADGGGRRRGRRAGPVL